LQRLGNGLEQVGGHLLAELVAHACEQFAQRLGVTARVVAF
jgi:hypothetical protein